jgi:hypothetical protein
MLRYVPWYTRGPDLDHIRVQIWGPFWTCFRVRLPTKRRLNGHLARSRIRSKYDLFSRPDLDTLRSSLPDTSSGPTLSATSHVWRSSDPAVFLVPILRSFVDLRVWELIWSSETLNQRYSWVKHVFCSIIPLNQRYSCLKQLYELFGHVYAVSIAVTRVYVL